MTKRNWGAFYGTDLDVQLRRRGVTQIVLGGIATSIGVESTARAAHEHGYHVTLATDAMADRYADTHRTASSGLPPPRRDRDDRRDPRAAGQHPRLTRGPKGRHQNADAGNCHGFPASALLAGGVLTKP